VILLEGCLVPQTFTKKMHVEEVADTVNCDVEALLLQDHGLLTPNLDYVAQPSWDYPHNSSALPVDQSTLDHVALQLRIIGDDLDRCNRQVIRNWGPLPVIAWRGISEVLQPSGLVLQALIWICHRYVEHQL
jgi:hypothetical protein